jgi:DNA-binding LacI/PurR family transcriptional regulator
MIKLQDVARRAGVSMATASLVMNNRPGVNDNTRSRVWEAARELGYSPNNRARGLALRKTDTIGLIVTDIENPFFGSITRYINEYAREREFNLILAISNDDLDTEDRIIENFISERVEGVIIIPTLTPKTETDSFRQLEKHQIPYVFITSYYPGIACDCVMTDLEAGSRRLCSYLLSLGHRKIFILVSSDRNTIPSAARIRGCRQAFEEAGMVFHENWILECTRTDFRSGFEKASQVVSREKPDAIIAINDIMALGAKRALKEMGYHIPKDISVAGYDDVIFSSISEIPLTTVKQDIPAISREAVRILIDRINRKRRSAQLYTIEPELVVRSSTGICSTTQQNNVSSRG